MPNLPDRTTYIGSSDAPVIMGVSPWKTLYELWEEKLGFGEDQKVTSAMSYGILMEPAARAWAEKELGCSLPPTFIRHATIDYLAASLDGYDETKKIAVEIKCPGYEDHERAKSGRIPEKYYPQVQHQIFCADLPFLYYVSYYHGEGIILKVERDEEYLSDLIAKEKYFWNHHILQIVAPELTERDNQIRKDEEWLSLAEEYRELKEHLDQLQDKESNLRAQLISMAGKIGTKGGGIYVRPYVCKGTVDYSKIPELKNIDLDVYRKPASLRYVVKVEK